MGFVLRSRLIGLDEFDSTILFGPTHFGPVRSALAALEFDNACAVRSELRPIEAIEVSFPAVRAWHVTGAILSGGFVVHRGAEIFADSSIFGYDRQFHDSILQDFVRRLTEIRGTLDDRYIGQQAMVFHNEGGGTWGHLLVQNLPRALAYAQRFPHAKIVVPIVTWNHIPNLRRLMAEFGLTDRVLLVDVSRSYQFRELTLVDFFYDFPRQIAHPAVLNWLSPWKFKDPVHSFFIERTSGTRLIANQKEVDGVLAKHKIARVQVGTMTVSEQIDLWGQARLVIGTLGSDFANIVFGRQGTKLLVLSPDWFGDIFFYNIASMKGMAWYELRCGRIPDGREPERDADFFVDTQRFEAMLAELSLT